MSFVLPEIVLQRAISNGIVKLKANEDILKGIFAQYETDELNSHYGTTYIDGIWDWFSNTKLPTVQSFSFDVQKVPCFSIHLASETDDETKVAAGDYFGMGEDNDEMVNPMTVMLDIGIHATNSKDHVLWMYYIVNYLLYKEKPLMRKLGLQLTTFSASEYNKDSQYMAENVWSRWVRFKCTVQNFLDGDDYTEIEDINVHLQNNRKDDIDDLELVPSVIPVITGE